MTCIVGLIHEGVTWIGGDSAGVSSQTTFRGKTKKVFQQGPYVIGYAGSYNLAQTIRWLKLPEPKPDSPPDDISRFMEVEFSGFLKNQVFTNEEEAALLVGIEGQLFELDAFFGVFEGDLPFNAIGGASELAVGALMACTVCGLDLTQPELTVLAALEVAHQLSPGNCQPPYAVVHTGDTTTPQANKKRGPAGSPGTRI